MIDQFFALARKYKSLFNKIVIFKIFSLEEDEKFVSKQTTLPDI